MELKPPTLAEIRAAHSRIRNFILRTPLVRFTDNIYLKLENLQPIGSFKIRGSGNAMEIAGFDRLARGVFTASAGNMAQGVAWNAQRMGVRSTAIVPEHAPETKTAAIRRFGGEIIRVPFDDWWNVMMTRTFPGMDGLFIHPVSDTAVMAGNGTIGLEIIEDLPNVESVYVPFGGGGLSSGIACAIRSLKRDVRIYAAEVETAAPLKASLDVGAPSACVYTASFVDGIGGKSVLPEMWPIVSTILSGSVTVSLNQTADAIRAMAQQNRVIAEGAGGAAVAAALASKETGNCVCVVSGGNIDFTKLITILSGTTP